MNCKLEKFWNLSKKPTIKSAPFMNCKLEKFWNKTFISLSFLFSLWTVNLKSFEIYYFDMKLLHFHAMNCKLEKFWNKGTVIIKGVPGTMNCKLEKFWNTAWIKLYFPGDTMNCKLEKFWNISPISCSSW